MYQLECFKALPNIQPFLADTYKKCDLDRMYVIEGAFGGIILLACFYGITLQQLC